MFDADRRINLSPDKRNIGMVFQSYALWPHMTVRKNIEYPLKARRIKEGIKAGWVEETAALVDCGALLDRYPAQLSGGQQQRVALARGLVARPDLVLFDEPLSNLDARLRDQVRAEIHELHGRLGFTAVFVTHDQSEALALGDRLAIMRNGRIEQYDTPEGVFEHPATEYVAAFIGMSNRLVCERADGGWSCDGQVLGGAPLQAAPLGGTVAVRLRSEDVELHPSDAELPADRTSATATIVDSEYGGKTMDVVARLADTRIFARISSGASGSFARRLTAGDRVLISFRPTDAMLYEAEADRTADAEAVGELHATGTGRSGGDLSMTTAISASSRSADVGSIARRLIKPIGLVVFVGALAYFVLEPLVRLQSKAFADGAAGYRTAFTADRIGRTIAYTIGLALGSLAIALVFGTLLAWAATRLPPKLRILRVVPVLPIVVPAIASVVGWAFLLSPRPGYLNAALRNLPWWSDLEEGPIDVYSLPWIVIITGIGLTAFVYLFVAAGFESISAEHLEAAQVAGSSPLGVFFKVTLPLLRPTLLYGGGVALLLGLGQFTAPLLLGRTAGIDVITTKIYADMTQTPVQYGSAAALGSTLLVFGVVVVAMQKVLLRDRKRFVTHGGKAFRSSGRPSKLAAVALVAYTFIATVLPVSALIVVSMSKFWSADIDVAGFTLDNFRQIFDQSNVTDAVYNSVTISIIAVVISLPLGFLAASIIVNGKRYGPLRAAADFLVAIPLGVPALLFGAGFLLTYTEGPFVLYGTRWVIVLVYVTLMLPFATRMQLSALVSLGDGYIEAARVSGSSVIGANLRVVLPLMRAALGGAAALIFVLLTHEFAASVLVRSSTTQVMGTVLYDYWGNGSYPLVAAIALVMSFVTLVGVVIAVMVGGSKALSSL